MAARPAPSLLRRAALRASARPRVQRAAAFCTTPTIRSPASPPPPPPPPPSSSFSSSSSSSTTSTTTRPPPPPNDNSSESSNAGTTHFGFQDGLSEAEKTERVAGVFHSVAESYDRMNDLMSFGIHRLWKDHFVRSLNPGATAPPTPADPRPRAAQQRILDVAGGTGDVAFRLLHHAHVVNGNPAVAVTMSDINGSMLSVGAARAAARLPAGQRAALTLLEADATRPFPAAAVPPGSVDLYTVAFGIRNFSSARAGLAEAFRVLRPGGVFACLEFSHPAARLPLLEPLYRRWSFGAIPLLGQLVAGDRDSYQYLVESIARFPPQEEFRAMIEEAGFVVGGRGYENLTGGVAAIHKGMKPLDA